MPMKEETRSNYTEQLYQAKKVMQQLLPLAEKTAGAVEAEWMPVWGKLEDVSRMLEWATVESPQVSNALKPAQASVNRLVRLFTGVNPLEQEEQAASDLVEQASQSDTAQARVIQSILDSGQMLMQAYQVAVEANPMAESLELFKDIKAMSAKILLLPREVAKLRGLEGKTE